MTEPSAELSPAEISFALAVATDFISHGIPLFTAPPDASQSSGFALPRDWQRATPDLRVLERWQPGWALCLVCGHGVDLIDVDIYHGGSVEALEHAVNPLPRLYASAATPSGGVHFFTSPIRVRSQNGVLPGIDVKAGDEQGRGRGFAFIAPTQKPSKMTGRLGKYTWVQVTAQ